MNTPPTGNFECVTIVMLEMGLSFFGIVFNLLVVATLRQEESIRGSTNNFLLFNLCFSNLIIAFLVKPMSAIYVGYAISSGSWEVGLTFCNLYTIVYHATWCIFPFTLVSMCWIKLLSQCRCSYCGILCCTSSRVAGNGSKSFEEEIPYIPSSNMMNEMGESVRGGKVSSRTLEDGPTAKQKTIISGIWILSFLFGFIFVFQDKLLGQKGSRHESKTFCKIRTGINDVFDYISLFVVFVLPLIIGPILIGISQCVFALVGRFICKSCTHFDARNEEQMTDFSQKGPGWLLISVFSFIFLFTYPIHMFLSEAYFTENYFTFLIVKYTVGSLFILLIPLFTVHLEKDIRCGMESLFNGVIICGGNAEEVHSSSRMEEEEALN